MTKELSNPSTFFVQRGATFWPESSLSSTVFDAIPPGNYTVGCTPQGQFFLETVQPFENKSKIYGDSTKMADRVIRTFFARSKNLGVLLAGEKGSGKSLLTRLISEKLASEHKVPTLVINSPMVGEGFFKFLYSINQPCVVLLDEFEKVYDKDDQEQMLTLLDGTFPSKKLWLLTCNDRWRLDSHMRNRPGRLHYMVEFKGLSSEFVREYCEDRLDDKSKIDQVVTVTGMFTSMNFDMLQAIVWEMNEYKESATEAMKMLNARPESEESHRYSVEITLPGVNAVFKGESLYKDDFYGHPLRMTSIHNGVYIKELLEAPGGETYIKNLGPLSPELSKSVDTLTLKLAKKALGGLTPKPATGNFLNLASTSSSSDEGDYDESQGLEIKVSIEDLVKIGQEKGTFIFRTKKGETLTLQRELPKEFDLANAYRNLDQ